MKNRLLKISAVAAVLLVASAGAVAASIDCCGDLACCVGRMLACCM